MGYAPKIESILKSSPYGLFFVALYGEAAYIALNVYILIFSYLLECL